MVIEAQPTPLYARESHAHHWMIASPDGPTAAGRCKRCGAERSFPNSNEAASWARDAEAEADTEVVQLRREIGRRRAEFRLSDEAA